MLRCLLVDDDAEIRAALVDYLRGYGFETLAVGDAAAMRRALAGVPFDVMVLDLMLPDANGLDLCREVHAGHPALPILMLTAQGDPASRIVGLELGADDYLGKPFEPRELVARLHAVLRRSGARRSTDAPAPQCRFAGWTFDRLHRQLVTPERVVVALSSAEFRLLMAFVEHPKRVLSRERLIALTRSGGLDVNDRSIDLAVSRLRVKLGDGAREPRLIRTLRGEGYLFDTEVTT
jgi:two-component system OmpR family response regulator